jgi:hypothetical protein
VTLRVFPVARSGTLRQLQHRSLAALKRCGSSGVHLWLWIKAWAGLTSLASNMRGGKTHRRNTGPMLSRPRCGARTRSGKPCRSPAVRGKRRASDAPGSGAPPGNKDALKHGQYTRRSSCGIKTAAQCLQAIARATAKDEVSDAPRPCTPTAATSSARVPSVSDDDAQNWRCRWGRVAEIWGAERPQSGKQTAFAVRPIQW